MGDATGTREDRECIMKPMALLGRRQRKGTLRYRIDSWDVPFNHIHNWTRPRTIAHHTWVLVINSSGQNGPMNQREDCEEARKFINVYMRNLAKFTTDFIFENKFDHDQTNNLLDMTKVRSASTQRQTEGDTTLRKYQALLPQDDNRLRVDSLLHDHRQQSGVSDNFLRTSWYIACSNDDSLVSEERGVNTTLNPLAQARAFDTSAHVIFSRVAQGPHGSRPLDALRPS